MTLALKGIASVSNHFADRLIAKCNEIGAPVCVGLDPVFNRLPHSLVKNIESPDDEPAVVHAIERFCNRVIKAVAPHVPAVKIQAACFERYRSLGMPAFFRVVEFAKSRDLIVIADAKRGDIGASSEHYAAALLGHQNTPQYDDPDALTVNSFMGTDGLQPFMERAANLGLGLFALVRTSNPGSALIQDLELTDGRTVSEAVADLIAKLGDQPEYVGESGYSLLGSVIGATQTHTINDLRKRQPHQIFLVPGVGAQGGTAADVKACFKEDGTGALITASRSIIYANDDVNDEAWEEKVAAAAKQFRDDVAAVLAD